MTGKWRHLVAVIASACMLHSPLTLAADAKAGAQKAITCQICHGPQGKSTNPIYPKLNGQHAKYVIKQLNAFKRGERKDAVMKEIATGMSDTDMRDVAAYFESIK